MILQGPFTLHDAIFGYKNYCACADQAAIVILIHWSERDSDRLRKRGKYSQGRKYYGMYYKGTVIYGLRSLTSAVLGRGFFHFSPVKKVFKIRVFERKLRKYILRRFCMVSGVLNSNFSLVALEEISFIVKMTKTPFIFAFI